MFWSGKREVSVGRKNFSGVYFFFGNNLLTLDVFKNFFQGFSLLEICDRVGELCFYPFVAIVVLSRLEPILSCKCLVDTNVWFEASCCRSMLDTTRSVRMFCIGCMKTKGIEQENVSLNIFINEQCQSLFLCR